MNLIFGLSLSLKLRLVIGIWTKHVCLDFGSVNHPNSNTYGMHYIFRPLYDA